MSEEKGTPGGNRDDRWRRLEVWQTADELARQVYLVTRGFPKEETHGLTSQLRRAALSVPTNIVEGYSRSGDRDRARFLNIGLGSLAETKYLLYFANSIGYLKDEEFEALADGYEKLGQRFRRFYETVRGTRG